VERLDGDAARGTSFLRQRVDYRTIIGWAAARRDIAGRRVFS
jgi:hypothetical protein